MISGLIYIEKCEKEKDQCPVANWKVIGVEPILTFIIYIMRQTEVYSKVE